MTNLVSKELRKSCSVHHSYLTYVEASLRNGQDHYGGMEIPFGEDTLFSLNFVHDQMVIT